MRQIAFTLSALLIALTGGGPHATQDPPPPSVVDLGHPLSEADPTWSGHPVFKHTTSTENGIFVGSFQTDEHFGTHVDAPAHFVPGGWTVDQIPVIRFVRPAVRIDLRAKALKDEDYRMTREDILSFERKNGVIAPGTVVLVMTGWDARWSEPARYRNEHDGALHFPGLSVEAAETLIQRDIAAIGIDTPSVDYGPSTAYEVHHATLPHDIYHIENVANLLAVPVKDFSVVVAPAYVKGGSGAPARVFAVVRP